MLTVWLLFDVAAVLVVFGFFLAGLMVGGKGTYVMTVAGLPVAVLVAVCMPLLLLEAGLA